MASSRFATATHVLVALEYLRRDGHGLVSSKNLAQSVGTNPVIVRELLRSLGKAGLVATTEGRNGGVRIAKDAKEINLRSVYVAVEAQGPLKESPRPVHKSCPVSCAMKGLLRPIYQEVDEAMLKVFDKKTISELTSGVPGRSAPRREHNQRR